MFMVLLERQRVAYERALFPFACLLAQQRNLAPFVKHDRQYTPEDFMPKARPREARKGPLGPEAFWRFKQAQGGTK